MVAATRATSCSRAEGGPAENRRPSGRFGAASPSGSQDCRRRPGFLGRRLGVDLRGSTASRRLGPRPRVRLGPMPRSRRRICPRRTSCSRHISAGTAEQGADEDSLAGMEWTAPSCSAGSGSPRLQGRPGKEVATCRWNTFLPCFSRVSSPSPPALRLRSVRKVVSDHAKPTQRDAESGGELAPANPHRASQFRSVPDPGPVRKERRRTSPPFDKHTRWRKERLKPCMNPADFPFDRYLAVLAV